MKHYLGWIIGMYLVPVKESGRRMRCLCLVNTCYLSSIHVWWWDKEWEVGTAVGLDVIKGKAPSSWEGGSRWEETCAFVTQGRTEWW